MYNYIAYNNFKIEISKFKPYHVNGVDVIEYNGKIYYISYTYQNVLFLYSALSDNLKIPVIVVNDDDMSDASVNPYISMIDSKDIYGFIIAQSEDFKSVNKTDNISPVPYSDVVSVVREKLSKFLMNKSIIITSDNLTEVNPGIFMSSDSKDFGNEFANTIIHILYTKVAKFTNDFKNNYAMDLSNYDILYRNVIIDFDDTNKLSGEVMCDFMLNKPDILKQLGIAIIYQDPEGRNIFSIEEKKEIDKLIKLYYGMRVGIVFSDLADIEADCDVYDLFIECLSLYNTQRTVPYSKLKKFIYTMYNWYTSNYDVLILSRNIIIESLNNIGYARGNTNKFMIADTDSILYNLGVLNILASISLTTDVIINCCNSVDQEEFETVCDMICNHNSSSISSDSIYFDTYIKNYKTLRTNKLVLTKGAMYNNTSVVFGITTNVQSFYQISNEERNEIWRDSDTRNSKVHSICHIPNISCVKYSILDFISFFYNEERDRPDHVINMSSYMLIDNMPANKYNFLSNIKVNGSEENRNLFVDYIGYILGGSNFDIHSCNVSNEILISYKRMYDKFAVELDKYFNKNKYLFDTDRLDEIKAKLLKDALPTTYNVNKYLTYICLLISQACKMYSKPVFFKDLIIFECNNEKYIGVIDKYPEYDIAPVEIGRSCVIYDSVKCSCLLSRKNTSDQYTLKKDKNTGKDIPSFTNDIYYVNRQAWLEQYRDPKSEKPGMSNGINSSYMITEVPSSFIQHSELNSAQSNSLNIFKDYLFDNYTKEILDYEIARLLCKNPKTSSVLAQLEITINEEIKNGNVEKVYNSGLLADYIRLYSVYKCNNKDEFRIINEVYSKFSVYSLRQLSYKDYIINAYGLKNRNPEYSLNQLKHYIPISGMTLDA